jgi:hypothetical protein
MENEGKKFLLTSLGSMGRVSGEIPEEIKIKENYILQNEHSWMRSCGVSNTKADFEEQHWN